jgi:hypothetical protein
MVIIFVVREECIRLPLGRGRQSRKTSNACQQIDDGTVGEQSRQQDQAYVFNGGEVLAGAQAPKGDSD